MPFVCCINVEEIWRGIRPDEEDDAGRLVDALRLADLGVAEGQLAGRWRREAAARGITLSQADCLIAAAAVGVGAQLATGNPKHFPMEELEVEHWPAGVRGGGFSRSVRLSSQDGPDAVEADQVGVRAL